MGDMHYIKLCLIFGPGVPLGQGILFVVGLGNKVLLGIEERNWQ